MKNGAKNDMFKNIDKIKEIIDRSKRGQVKLFTVAVDVDLLISYIEYLENYLQNIKKTVNDLIDNDQISKN
jgi:hypothetical protein